MSFQAKFKILKTYEHNNEPATSQSSKISDNSDINGCDF